MGPCRRDYSSPLLPWFSQQVLEDIRLLHLRETMQHMRPTCNLVASDTRIREPTGFGTLTATICGSTWTRTSDSGCRARSSTLCPRAQTCRCGQQAVFTMPVHLICHSIPESLFASQTCMLMTFTVQKGGAFSEYDRLTFTMTRHRMQRRRAGRWSAQRRLPTRR